MRKIIHLAFIVLIAFMAYQLMFVWQAVWGQEYLTRIALSLDDRPYVYRMLLPLLAQGLSWLTGAHVVYCLWGMAVVASIGLFYSLRYLYLSFADDHERADLVAFVGYLAVYALTFFQTKPYDIPTAMFFALGLALLRRGKYPAYYLMFILATLNRETTFLLILFFMVLGFGGYLPRSQFYLGAAYQFLVYILIKGATTLLFADLPGTMALWTFPVVLIAYVHRTGQALALLSSMAIVLFMALRHWDQKPAFLRLAFLSIFPVQVLLYVLMGMPGEVRVFAESMPVLIGMISYPVIVEKVFLTE